MNEVMVFVTDDNPENPGSRSHYVYKSLCKDYYIRPVIYNELGVRSYRASFLSRFYMAKGKSYPWIRSVYASKAIGKALGKRLKVMEYDLVFVRFASTALAFLNQSKPVIYLSDAVFGAMASYYPKFSNISKRGLNDGNEIDALALSKASAIVLTSEWAKKSAIELYGIPESKVSVVPLGAYMDDIPSLEVVKQRKLNRELRLLFFGLSWSRKGGDYAAETVRDLRKKGIKASLVVAGTKPPEEFRDVISEVYPVIDKNRKEHRDKLRELYQNCDFLLLPTRAEAFGVAFSEAAAFGLPVITTDTGGVSSVVQNGVNGYRLPLEAKGSDYSELIEKSLCNYEKLVVSSKEKYERELSWNTWRASIKSIISGISE